MSGVSRIFQFQFQASHEWENSRVFQEKCLFIQGRQVGFGSKLGIEQIVGKDQIVHFVLWVCSKQVKSKRSK